MRKEQGQLQVQKGGERIITTAVEEKNGVTARSNSNRSAGATKKSGVNKSLKRYFNSPII